MSAGQPTILFENTPYPGIGALPTSLRDEGTHLPAAIQAVSSKA